MTGSHWTTVMTTATTTAAAAGAVLGSVAVFVSLNVDALAVEHSGVALSSAAESEIAQVEAEIDRIEQDTVHRLSEPPDNQVQQIRLLGKSLLYDKQLSVNRNEACAFCHMPEAGFHRSGIGTEPDHRFVSGFRAYAIWNAQAAIPRLCAALAGAAYQSVARGPSSAEISGTCVRPVCASATRLPNRRKRRRSIPSNGPAGYGLHRLPRLAAPVRRHVQSRVGRAGFRN